jgi:hypothetical protein
LNAGIHLYLFRERRWEGCGPDDKMEAEDAYETAVKKFKADAAVVQAAWVAQGDGNMLGMLLGMVYSLLGMSNAAKAAACLSVIQKTSYRDMGWRRGSLWSACPHCHLPASGSGDNAHALQKRLTAGYRWNGDAYGSNLFMCTVCGFTDYCSWDEA